MGQELLGGIKIQIFLDIHASGDKIKHKEMWTVPNINSLDGKAGKQGEIKITVFWLKIDCSVVGRYQHARGTSFLHLQSRTGKLKRKKQISPQYWYIPICEITWHHSQVNCNLKFHHHENYISCILTHCLFV